MRNNREICGCLSCGSNAVSGARPCGLTQWEENITIVIKSDFLTHIAPHCY